MSHEVEAMFSVKQTPWHGLGTILESAPTAAEAIRAAGLDWDVELVPVMTDDGQLCRGFSAIRRQTDSRVYGIVGQDYGPLQNRQAFSFFDPYVAAGEASLETAGSLRTGARVWILAKLNRAPSEIRPGDTVEKFLLLSTSHDGTVAVRVGFSPIRVVCANTLKMAHADGRSQLIRVKHSKSVTENVEKIREIVNVADAKFEATADQYRALARREINQADLEAYVTEVFELAKPESDEQTIARLLGETDTQTVERVLSRKSRVMTGVTEAFESGRGHELAGATYWGAYNAVTEYVQHERGNDPAKRLDSAWFGQGAAVNQRALDVAIGRAS